MEILNQARMLIKCTNWWISWIWRGNWEKGETSWFLVKPTWKNEKAIKKQYILRDQQRREIGQWLPAKEKKLGSDSSSVGTGTVFTVGRFVLWMFARKFITLIFFLKIFGTERWWVSDARNVKKMGVTDFVLERTWPEERLNLSKSGFVSEEGHSTCKSQNIAIWALKGIVLCQIWFKWTY